MWIIAWNENATGVLEVVIKEEGKLGNVLKGMLYVTVTERGVARILNDGWRFLTTPSCEGLQP